MDNEAQMSLVEMSFANNIPKIEDFRIKNNQGNYDVAFAINKYFGKDIGYVKKYFCYKSCYGVLDDIRYIGATAFSYYLVAIMEYIMQYNLNSKNAVDIYDILCEIPDILKEKIITNKKQLKKIFRYIVKFSKWVLENEKHIDKDSLFCNDLKQKYVNLIDICG